MFIINFIILSCLVFYGQSAGVLKILIPHPNFRAGRYTFLPSSNNPTAASFTLGITYSSSFSNVNNLYLPVLGIFSIDINVVSSTSLLFNISVLSYGTSGFSAKLKVRQADLVSLTYSYLSFQSTTYYIHPQTMSWIGPWDGPQSTSQTSSNFALGMSFSSNCSMLIFIDSFVANTTSLNLFRIAQTGSGFNPPETLTMAMEIPSQLSIAWMRLSMLIIDNTAFVNSLPTGSIYQTGIITSSNNYLQLTTISDQFNESLIIGLYQFSFNQNKMVIESKLDSTKFSMASQNFMTIKYSYFFVKYYSCPPNNTFYMVSQNLCYDDCGLRYFNKASTLTCQKCAYQCGDCTNQSKCISCQDTDNRQLNANGDDCIPKTGFFDNGTTIAEPCQSPCATCQNSNTTCLSCIDNTYNYNSGSNTCTLCNTLTDFCLTCQNGNCLSCQTGYKLVGSLCSQDLNPCSSTLSANGCLACQTGNINKCIECDQINGFYLNPVYSDCSASAPGSCTGNGCIICFKADPSKCSICDSSIGYYLNPALQICEPKCGDSIFVTQQQCQDGNLDNMDGCSYICKIQQGFDCPKSNITNLSDCTYTLPINFTIDSLLKESNQNQVKALMTLRPPLKAFENYDFSKMVSTDLPITQYIFNYNKDTGVLQMIMKYNETIDGRICTVTINPPNIGVFLGTASSHLQITMKSQDLIPLNYYEDNYYQASKILFFASILTAVLGWICLFVGTISGKIIGLEVLGIIQLTFFSLFSFSNPLSPGFQSLSGLAYSNGLNIFFFVNPPSYSTHTLEYNINNLPVVYRQLLMKVPFLQNYNLDLFFLLIPLITALIITIVKKVKESKGQQQNLIKNPQQKSWLSKFLYELTLTGLISTQYIIFCALGIQFKFCLANMQSIIDYISIAIGLILVIPYIAYFILLIKKNDFFGQFNNFFSIYQTYSNNFYNYVMVQRCVIGLSLSLTGSPFALIVPLILTVCHFLVVLIKKPYAQNKQNYRVLANMIIQFILILSIMALSIVSFTSSSDSATTSPAYTNSIVLYFPIIILLLLLVLIVYNFIFLIIYIISSKEKVEEKKNLEIQIADLSKLRMQAYEMNQFLPSPFVLLKDELNKRKGITSQMQKQQDISTNLKKNYKGGLLSKDFINQVLIDRTKANNANQIYQINPLYKKQQQIQLDNIPSPFLKNKKSNKSNEEKDKKQEKDVSNQNVNKMRLFRAQLLQNSIKDEQIAQQWDQIQIDQNKQNLVQQQEEKDDSFGEILNSEQKKVEQNQQYKEKAVKKNENQKDMISNDKSIKQSQIQIQISEKNQNIKTSMLDYEDL